MKIIHWDKSIAQSKQNNRECRPRGINVNARVTTGSRERRRGQQGRACRARSTLSIRYFKLTTRPRDSCNRPNQFATVVSFLYGARKRRSVLNDNGQRKVQNQNWHQHQYPTDRRWVTLKQFRPSYPNRLFALFCTPQHFRFFAQPHLFRPVSPRCFHIRNNFRVRWILQGRPGWGDRNKPRHVWRFRSNFPILTVYHVFCSLHISAVFIVASRTIFKPSTCPFSLFCFVAPLLFVSMSFPYINKTIFIYQRSSPFDNSYRFLFSFRCRNSRILTVKNTFLCKQILK